MKTYALYGSVVCITCIFTVLIFLDFRKQLQIAETFRQAIHDSHLIVRHLLIAPEHIKVKDWQVGDSSAYYLRTNSETKTITFQVASQYAKDNNRFWLRTTGLIQFNEIDTEIWRLLDKTNIRPGSEKRGFVFSDNAVPFPLSSFRFPQNPVVFEKLGDEIVVTPIGNLKCEHAFAYVRSPNGELEPLLELWTNPTVRPLGLVRARWRDASLDLIKADTKVVPKIPSVLLAEFDRDTPLDGLCTRCHAHGIGGKNLKFESVHGLSGDALNITSALFHHRQAEMLKIDDLIQIKLIEKSRRARRKASARFSWKNGSFWIKPNRSGELVFSLDAIAHQGNITIYSSTGRLYLDIQE